MTVSPAPSSNLTKFKKTFGGFILSIASILLNVIANVLVKKATFYSGFEMAFLRFSLQFFMLASLAKYLGHNLLVTKKELRNLLLTRGVIGAIGMPCHFTSLKLVDPSDTIAIFSCNVIIIMVMSRFYLKEKLTIVHVMAVFVILSGVMMIAQPSFLHVGGNVEAYNETMIRYGSNLLNTSNQTTSSTDGLSEGVTKALGLCLAAVSGTIYAICTILIKTLQKSKVHFTVVNLYASYFGMPMSLLFTTISIGTGYTPKNLSLVSQPEFAWDTFFAISSALLGVVSQMVWIISLKLEDASKIAMYRSTDLMFTFMLQYILLGIESDFLKIVGAVLITSGIFVTMAFKLIDNREMARRSKFLSGDKNANFSNTERKNGFLKKILFYKF